MHPSAPKLPPTPVSLKNRGFVFISYKREDVAHAERLRKLLEASGFHVWWDMDIQCGQVWNQVLDDAVRDAGCIVVLWSTLAMKSPWVTHEASRAMDRGNYAPVRIELCPIHAPYDRIQATDIVDWNGDPNHAGVQRLLSRVESLLPKPLSTARRLRKWARKRIGVISAVVFALLALSILMWQTRSGQRLLSDLQAMRKGQDVLLPRIATKFARITANMSIRLPIGHPAVAEYVKNAIPPMAPNQAGSFEPWPASTGKAGEITMAQFIKERALPVAIVIQNASSGTDLSMQLKRTAPYRSVQKDPRALEVRYMGMQVSFQGSLQSLSDIAGAKLTVEYQPGETVLPSDALTGQTEEQRKLDTLLNEIQAEVEITDLELTFDGQAYPFKGFAKDKSAAPGKLSFSMVVPKDLKELREE
jgi:hypothetical protein